MISYFPTPYPDELWYSVMCRYHLRSGSVLPYIDTGNQADVISMVIPGNDIAGILGQLSDSPFLPGEVIWEHTLFPFFSRLCLPDMRKQWFEDLCGGTASYRQKVFDVNTLKYCPLCRKEEIERQGESYWHREHQLPMATVCVKHKCRLHSCYYGRRNRTRRVALLPEMAGEEEKTDHGILPWELPLSRALADILRLPMDAGARTDENGLYSALLRNGYRRTQKYRCQILDKEKLYADMAAYYGKETLKPYFRERISRKDIADLRAWRNPYLEIYVMAAVMMGITPEEMFGMEQAVSETA